MYVYMYTGPVRLGNTFLNIDKTNMRKCILVLMVPLDSLKKYVSLTILVKVLS